MAPQNDSGPIVKNKEFWLLLIASNQPGSHELWPAE